MTRFRCLAEACEDTCCSGLRVPVDAGWAERTDPLVRGTDFEAEATTASRQGFIEMRGDGSCPFLGAERLCGLQKNFGARALPSICASFPRTTWTAPQRTQLSGTLACPEVARLVLLAKDAMEPLELAEADAVGFPPAAASGTFQAARVHDAMALLFARTGYPLHARLVFAAQLAFALSVRPTATMAPRDDGRPTPAPGAGTDGASASEDRGPGDAGDMTEVDEILEHFGARELLDALAQRASAMRITPDPVLRMQRALLVARLADSRGARFDEVATRAVELLGRTDAFIDRAAASERAFGPLLSRAFDNAAAHHLTRNAVFAERSTLRYVLTLSFKLAFAKTLFLAHPALPDALATQDDGSAAAALVAAFQISARHLEQAPAVTALVSELCSGQPEDALGRALIFAAFQCRTDDSGTRS